MLDVRKPISLFFFIIGGIVVAYGFLDPKTIPVVTPQGAYPVNLNIPWGGVMMAFALAIGSIALWDDATKEEAELLEKERAEAEAEEADFEEADEGDDTGDAGDIGGAGVSERSESGDSEDSHPPEGSNSSDGAAKEGHSEGTLGE